MPIELIGIVLPPLIDIINTRVKNDLARLIIAFVISLGVGALTTFVEGNLKFGTISEVFESGSFIFIAAHTSYKVLWEKSDTRKDIFGARLKDR